MVSLTFKAKVVIIRRIMTANIQFSGIIFFWATERKLTFTAKTVSCLAITVNNKVHYLTVNI